MTNINDSHQPREIAAIDLGSNSFHMVVARVVGQSLQIISRHKQRVHLASGLDQQHNLNQAAINRGLNCLAMFAERLQGFAPENVRIAATYTLRQARNAHLFLQRAERVLPFPIEIIPGTEEARLIYLGVAHTHPNNDQTLVIDIGGGSTELVIGQAFDTHLLTSKHMGCVSYHHAFFANGKLDHNNIMAAQLAARQKLEPITNQYKNTGWQHVIGASGTIKAIREVFIAQGHLDGVITRKRLQQLIDILISFKHQDNLALAGLTEERQPVFAAGVAILSAVFDALNIHEMHFSRGALREGVLYEMEQRFRHADIRTRTASAMAKQYNIHTEQAKRVQATALAIYQQIDAQPGIQKSELSTLLSWGALLHEVGLSISYSGFHRHSAYLLRYSTMPGFNIEQQTVLSTLVRYQRKALKLAEMPLLTIYKPKHLYPLIRTLRLAVIFNAQRNDVPPPTIKVRAKQAHWQLCLPEGWITENKLLAADLEAEQAYWQRVGWQLELI